MSLASFAGSLHNADRIRAEALDILRQLNEEPPTSSLGFKFRETECVVLLLGGEFGIYGAGALYIEQEQVGEMWFEYATISPTLLVDPLWLAHDFERVEARTPLLLGYQAHWARPRLEELLGHISLEDTVLQASAQPRPFAVGPGDATKFTGTGGPVRGTVGPRVRFNQQSGFLTAGHVAPVDVAGNPSQASIEATDSAGMRHVGVIQITRKAAAYGTAAGRSVTGDIDAAIVTFAGGSSTGSGAGGAGQAAANDSVSKTGAKTGLTQGKIASYLVWAGGSKGIWRDCYGIVLGRQSPYPSFAEGGDSGSSVTLASGTTIGMVVGGAVLLPGCTESVAYAQDIEEIEAALGCAVVP
jgi:hypothetical protein